MSPTISQLGAIPLQSFSTCQKLSPQLSRGVFARFWQVSDIVRRNFNVREGGFCVTKWIRKGAKPGRIECKRRSLSKKRWSRGTIAEGTSFICQMLFKPPENVSRWGQNKPNPLTRDWITCAKEFAILRKRKRVEECSAGRMKWSHRNAAWIETFVANFVPFRGILNILLAGKRCNGIDSGTKLNQVVIINVGVDKTIFIPYSYSWHLSL